MTGTLHKLTAGDGYTYLTKQVAAHDSTNLGRQELADYYSEKGERPGSWLGRGLAGLDGVEVGDEVTADQMKNLFGLGSHPEREAIIDAQIAAGATVEDAIKAAELGAPFQDLNAEPSQFRIEVTRAFFAHNTQAGKPRDTPIDDADRAAIRSRVGREVFTQKYGRAPLDDRELTAFVARESRPARQQVAGYDLTFSAVKSVSILWGTASKETSRLIEDAHDAAVRDVIAHLEDEVLYTRRGKGGALHVPVRGVLATAFTHRDSRSGDPDLHTHVAISNKVQDPTDGAWLAIDGRVLHKAMVGLSERYNTALERELNRRLGVEFAERSDTVDTGKRPIREVRGFTPELVKGMSSRRAEIEAKVAELQREFRAAHHRAPTPKESVKLHQQANLATRERKREPHSFDELRDRWTRQLSALLGEGQSVEGFVDTVLSNVEHRTATLTDHQIDDLAGRVVAVVEQSRARFSIDHLAAEAQRQISAYALAPDAETATIERVIRSALTDRHSVRIGQPDPIQDPEVLLDKGRSLFDTPRFQLHTTTRMLAAEQRVVDAAHRRGARTVTASVVATALMEQVANGHELDAAQAQMVTEMATNDSYVQLCLAPAGSGKTTSMRVLARAWQDSGGQVLGLAPSAAAAAELREAIEVPTDTLAKLVWHARHPAQELPWWMAEIGPDTLLMIDEAGMASTTDLDVAITYVTSRGGTVRLIGDDQQLASVAAGGVLREVAHDVGAVTLSELHRFADPAEAANTLLLRDGDVESIGFLLDRRRIQVAGEEEAPSRVYNAWLADTSAGKTALMLAHATSTVTDLNRRARTDRVAAGRVDDTSTVALASDVECGRGDVIVTRINRRDLRLTRTDFVKNGDRWIVESVHDDGGLTVRHETLARSVQLPADYVASSVDLGYASTIHGAQGQTVDSSYTLLTGTENRQLAYVALTRGRTMNGAVIPLGGDGDPHNAILPDTVLPPTAVELLERVIRRDGAKVAALTEHREQSSPVVLLARAVERYENAVRIAAVETVGQERMQELTRAAEHAVPGLTAAPAWDTLAAHLAVLDLSGVDPIEQLRAAAASRELDTARDIAAVLDFRLDTSGGHSGGTGPLPWLTGIPDQLRTTGFGEWLTQRHHQVAGHQRDLHDSITSQTPEDLPEWAAPLADSPRLLAEVAAWRAAHRVPDEDTTPTGPWRLSIRERRYQEALTERYEHVAGPPLSSSGKWSGIVTDHSPWITSDPWWVILHTRLDLAYAAGLPVERYVREALEQGPLPDDHTAAALWSRLETNISPSTGVSARRGSGAARLRPDWTPALIHALPDGVGARVLADPAWPTLVAATNHAAQATGLGPDEVITQAVDLIGQDYLPHLGDRDPARMSLAVLATALAWRVTDLTSTRPEPDQHVDEADFHDAELEAFVRTLAAEQDDSSPIATPAALADVDDAFPVSLLDPPVPDEETIPELDAGPGDGHDDVVVDPERDRILELNAAAADYFTAAYQDSPAQQHLLERFGEDPAEFGYLCGYAPRTGLVDHLRHTCEATDDELLAASLGQARDGKIIDFFRDRAVIGVHNARGDLVGFTGRDLTGYEKSPKYKNTATTPAFAKGRVLFGLHERHQSLAGGQSPTPVLVEGPMDAIAVTIASNGAAMGVSPGGTAFTDYQADLLAAVAAHEPRTADVDEAAESTMDLYPARFVLFGLDNDRAGQQAATRAHDMLLARDVTPRSLVFTANDPADALTTERELLSVGLTPAMHSKAPLAVNAIVTDLLRTEDGPERRSHLAHNDLPFTIAALDPEHWDAIIRSAVTVIYEDHPAPETVTQRTHDSLRTMVEESCGLWQPSPRAVASASDRDEASLRAHHHQVRRQKLRAGLAESRPRPTPTPAPRRPGPTRSPAADEKYDERYGSRSPRRDGPTLT